jgi:hypothetical protein
MRRFIRPAALATIVSLAMLAVSCSVGGGGERLPESGATLEGVVKYGTEQLHAALIIVTSDSGSATGNINEDTGRYKVENVPLGTVKIAVNTDAAKGQLQGKMMSGYYQGPDAKAKGKTTPPKIIEVPAKYGAPETSGITTTVSKGANTYDITIPK